MTEREVIMNILRRLVGKCEEFNDGKSAEYINQYGESIVFDFDTAGNVALITN